MSERTNVRQGEPILCDLEPRVLLAAGGPTGYAQYLLELINRARANPAAEAARLNVSLNSGVPVVSTITTDAKQPLAFNADLLVAATGHVTEMFAAESFDRAGADDSTPADRILASGYAADAVAENDAVRMFTTGFPNMLSDTAGLHQDLFVDSADANRADRINLMDEQFREVGIGVLGSPVSTGSAIAAAEDFAVRAGNPFLTGVVYDNRLALMDSFYTPGEGIGDVTVTAVRHGGGSFSTTTWGSGGYSLQLAPGLYDVSFSGGPLAGTFAFDNVVISGDNVKQDLALDSPPPTPDLAVPATVPARRIYVRPGEAFTVHAVVQNIGNAAAAGPFTISIYRSDDSTVTSADTLVDSRTLASLAAGAASTADRTLTAPLAEGTYYLAVIADDTNAVPELSELNNTGTIITLIVGHPDLQPSFASFAPPASLVPGDRLTVPVVVANAGAIPAAGSITAQLYASAGLTGPVPGDVLLAAIAGRSVNIAPGGAATLSFSVALTDALPAGTWHLLAVVDTTDAVDEGAGEGNNTAATTGTFDEVWRFGTFGTRRGASLAVHDGSGTLATFSLAGPGWGDVTLVAGGFDVVLHANTAATTFRLSTNGPATTLNSVTIPGSINSVSAAKAALVGTLDVGGSAAGITLGDLDGAAILLHTDAGIVLAPSAKASLTLGSIRDSAIDAGDEPINSLVALDWLDAGGSPDAITARSLATLTVKGRTGAVPLAGDFEPALTLSGALGNATVAGTLRGQWSAVSVTKLKAANLDAATISLSQVPAAKAALGSLTVARWVTDSRILAAGNIGPVSVGGISGSDIFAAVNPQAHGLPDPTTAFLGQPQARLASLSVTGAVTDGGGHSIIDTGVAAWHLGAIHLAKAQALNTPSAAWGLCGHLLDSYSYKEVGLSYSWNKRLTPTPTQPGGDFEVLLA